MNKNADHYAIVIGINKYAGFPSLQSAVADADAFHKWLSSDQGGGIPHNNIRLLFTPADPASPTSDIFPTRTDMDQALVSFGIGTKTRIGKRLYFYFAGHGFGPTFDDVGMLMADASPPQLSSISLREYRNFLRMSGAFDELVYILDTSRNSAQRIEATGSVPFHSSNLARVVEFVLMASSHEGHSVDSPTGGFLTKAVLEGLSGLGSNPRGKVTAVSLSKYVQKRVLELGDKKQRPEALLPTEEIILAEVPSAVQNFMMIVELPHWTADIRIFDNLFRPVSGIGPAIQDPSKPGIYIKQVRVPPGIYKVEALMENQSNTQHVSVFPDQSEPSRIKKSDWKPFKLTSAAPLEGTTTADKTHTDRAIEWSNKPTAKLSANGNSCLFLFVRTQHPDRFKQFATGLELLDANENLLTDFSEGIQVNPGEGWMACCRYRQAGYYILRRRRRRGVPVQHLPIFLCAGFQTQVFLGARNAPSFRSLTLNMAPLGKGFQPNDETAIAAKAVLDGMKYGVSRKSVITGEKLAVLLRQKLENPWLGILAAFALRSQDGISENPTGDTDSVELFQIVMNHLNQTVADHPDVRALGLKQNEPPPAPFPHPPLLRSALALVQQHAINFVDTIPANTLTDRVLDAETVNSPWTIWGRFAQLSVPKTRKKSKTRSISFDATEESLSFEAGGIPKSIGSTPLSSAQKLPDSESVNLSTLRDAEMVLASRKFNAFEVENLPESLSWNPSSDLKSLIENIQPKEISSQFGIPLSRANNLLEGLRIKSDEFQKTWATTQQSAALPIEERAVVEFALQKVVQTPFPASPGVSEPQTQPRVPTSYAIKIEDLILKLQEMADSLQLKRDIADVKVEDVDIDRAKDIAHRLRAMANHLRDRAVVTVLTDSDGRILQSDSLFAALMNPHENARTHAGLMPHKRAWEAALAQAPLGSSTLTNPVPGSKPEFLTLRRSVIQDDNSKNVFVYLNVLRAKDSRLITDDLLLKIDSILSSMQLYVSFYIYDEPANRENNAASLRDLLQRLEQLVG